MQPTRTCWPPAPVSLCEIPKLPGKGEIHVWLALLDVREQEEPILRSLLESDEVERANRYRFKVHRNRFIAGRAQLRTVLARYLAVEPRSLRFRCGDFGKPELAVEFGGKGLSFNLAHSESLGLIALGRDCRVGVDIERVRPLPDMDELVQQFFSAREARVFRELDTSDKPVAFFNLWTRKEAWLKATGAGIAHHLNRVEVSFLPGEPVKLLSLPPNLASRQQWTLHELTPGDGFAAALAVDQQLSGLRFYRCHSADSRAVRLEVWHSD